MKKMISLLLVLVLGLSAAAAAAEEAGTVPAEDAGTVSAEPAAVYWADLAPAVEKAGIAGQYYTLDSVKAVFWVPAFLQPFDSDATYGETGALAWFKSEDQKWGLVVSFYPLEVESIEEFAGMVPSLENVGECKLVSINGVPACSFVFEDVLHVSYYAGEHSILSFDFYPASDYVYSAVSRFIAASIAPYDPDAGSESAE